VVDFKENSTSESVVEFLEKISIKNFGKEIILILDNFRPHRSKFTTKTAENLNIKLVYLPPYSPDLNPIEFVWKSIKREISPLLINNLEELRENIKINFYNLTKSISFANKWIKKFLKNKNII